jgi:hypothetical protein
MTSVEPSDSPPVRGAPVREGVPSPRAVIDVRIGIEFMRLTLDPEYRVLRYAISVIGTHLSDGKHVPDLVRGACPYEGIKAIITRGLLPVDDGYCIMEGRMKERNPSHYIYIYIYAAGR